MNGINYTSAEVEEQAHFLSTLFGCRVRSTWRPMAPLLMSGIRFVKPIPHYSYPAIIQVRPYYNPSLGWWLKDLTRVSYMYIRSPTEDPVVTGLAKHLSMVRACVRVCVRACVQRGCRRPSHTHNPALSPLSPTLLLRDQVLREVGPTGRVVHLAHSGGALLTYLVAKYHLKYVSSALSLLLSLRGDVRRAHHRRLAPHAPSTYLVPGSMKNAGRRTGRGST